MSKAAKEFVAYISEPAIVEIIAGVVHISERSGDIRVQRAMSVKTFQRHLERGQRALERFARGEQDIVIDD